MNTTITMPLPHLPVFRPDRCTRSAHNPWGQRGQELGRSAEYNATTSSKEDAVRILIPWIIKCRQVARFVFPEEPHVPYWKPLPRITLKPSSYYIVTWESSQQLFVVEIKKWPGRRPVERNIAPGFHAPYTGREDYYGEDITLGFDIRIWTRGNRAVGEIALFEVSWPQALELETQSYQRSRNLVEN